ncbi:hypothetical protein ACHAWF_008938 [Thalassiosira exigua]
MFSAAMLVIRFAEYLLQNYGKDPEVTWILDFTEIHIMPITNPDGRVYLEKGGSVRNWKKNRNNAANCQSFRYGVDLNRNFPFMWGQCGVGKCSSSPDCDSIVYRGPRPQSEQETRAIVQYAKSIFPSSQRKGDLQTSMSNVKTPFPLTAEGVFIDVHSHGKLVGWPYGFTNERSPNDEGLGALGRKMASYSGYKLWAPEMPNRQYGFSGSSLDTMHGLLGVSSYFLELGTAPYQPCDQFPQIINENFPALIYAAKVARFPYIAPLGPDILCTTITSVKKGTGNFIRVSVDVSDDARTKRKAKNRRCSNLRELPSIRSWLPGHS